MPVLQKVRWPPAELGLGTPANLALLSPSRRAVLPRTLLLAALAGVVTVCLLGGIDHFFFNGSSIQRIRALGALPLSQRVAIVAFSAVTEEVVYRLILASALSTGLFLAIRRVDHAAMISMWFGIVTAALLFGLAHAANLAAVPHPYLRAIVINGIAGLVLGALYWFQGLEAAVVAHLAADVTIYLVIASLI
jgi:membrane protease YdiL (CAAX protease family)